MAKAARVVVGSMMKMKKKGKKGEDETRGDERRVAGWQYNKGKRERGIKDKERQ